MLLALALVASAPADEVAPAPRLLGEFVELKTSTGTLYDTLDLPPKPGPWPVVIMGVTVPVLVVSGSTDIQVSGADARRLGDAIPKAKVVTIDEMNHVLKRVKETARLAQLPFYADPSVPLHPELAPALVGFLKPALGGK
jgi:hypothetical protein